MFRVRLRVECDYIHKGVRRVRAMVLGFMLVHGALCR